MQPAARGAGTDYFSLAPSERQKRALSAAATLLMRRANVTAVDTHRSNLDDQTLKFTLPLKQLQPIDGNWIYSVDLYVRGRLFSA